MNKRITPSNITSLSPNEVFVFGSNTRGVHGAGAARTALQWGARYGEGHGLQGQTYALATVRVPGEKLPMLSLQRNINDFIAFASLNPGRTFLVTEVGCGLAGFSVEEVAPLFADAVNVPNINLPASFWAILTKQP